METLTKLGNRARIRRSAQQWRELLNRFDQSGQTRERFCTEQGLALSSFTRWRGKLREQRAAVPDGAGEAVFVELAPGEAVSVKPPRPWELELQLGAGVVVRLRRSPC